MAGVSPPTAEAPFARRLATGLGWLLVAVAIWVARFLLPSPPAPPELDPSWQQGLSYALAHGFQFGREILFTFGPLGGIAHGRYQPEIFWIQLIGFELLFKGLLVWRWVDAVKRWPSGLDRAAIVLALCVGDLGSDAFFFATTVMLASFHFEATPPSGRRRALDFLLIATIAFIKFTYFLLAAGVILIVVVRYALRGWRAGAAALGGYALAVLAIWTLCRQWPWNLPIYLVRSFSIASGYSEAQAYDGPIEEVRRGVMWIVLLAAIVALTAFGSRFRRERLLAGVVVLGGAYVAFKASFTYHLAHGITFFGFGTLALSSLLPPVDASSARRVLLGLARAVSLCFCIAGLGMRYNSPQEMVGFSIGESAQGLLRNATALGNLGTLRERREENAVAMRKLYDLPRIRGIVGDAEIDMVSNGQSWILLNGLDWKPRPVFQSYVTVSPSLIALNERFYRGKDAPEYVLVDLGTIDKRLSGMEDSGTLLTLLRRYTPVATERDMVLLRRNPEPEQLPPPQIELLEEREVLPNEVIRLDQYEGQALRVRIEVEYSLLGKLRKLFYHAPVTWIRVQLSDNSTLRQRLIPGMSSSGFLVRPFIMGNYDWVRLFTRGHQRSIKAFVVASQDDWDTFFAPRIKLAVERCDGLIPKPRPRMERDLAFGSFATQPILCTSATDIRSYMIGTREVVLVGPKSDIGFALQPGPHRLTGKFGMLDHSLGRSDGVDYLVVRVSKDGQRTVLFERTFLPQDAEHLEEPVDVAFDSEPGDRLVLSTVNPEGRHYHADLAWWDSVRID